jgi:hypothetical protein
MPRRSNELQKDRKRACILKGIGSRLSALCVWLVAQDHFQFYHIDPNLLLTLRTIEWEIDEDCILVHLSSRFAAAPGAADPMRTMLSVIHWLLLGHPLLCIECLVYWDGVIFSVEDVSYQKKPSVCPRLTVSFP